GASLEVVVQALFACGDDLARTTACRLIASTPFRDVGADALLKVLGSVAGADVTEVLTEIWLSGTQSVPLREELCRRSGVLDLARRHAFGRGPRRRTERAVELLGFLADAESVAALDDLVARGRCAITAMDAMVRIADEESILRLPRHFRLSHRAPASSFQARLGEGIAVFGEPGARLYLDRIQTEVDPHEREYLFATGFCATPDMAPEVAALVVRDELKICAVSALERMACPPALAELERLVLQPDSKVRIRAMQALRRLRPSPSRAKDGYARSGTGAGRLDAWRQVLGSAWVRDDEFSCRMHTA
ncbi:MAG: hypothetical protein KDB53_19805, partial [Planctomycetes bacterium]|nr:hypothetical protein [Planctomycetota bacterium]